jgi:hypothetical protein
MSRMFSSYSSNSTILDRIPRIGRIGSSRVS